MLNLGHAAFIGIGAYTSALLTISGVPWPLAVLAAALLAAIGGGLIGLPCMKLRGDYLAIATLGFGEIIRAVLKNWVSLTNGPLGIKGIPKPELFGFVFSTSFSYLLLMVAFTSIILWLSFRLIGSPFGRVLRAIREDDIAAAAIGKHVAKYKVQMFMIGAAFAGISGSLYAHYITFIDPATFDFLASVYIVEMVIIGGLGNIWGSVLGASLITVLYEPLRFIGLPPELAGGIRFLIFGVLLVVIMLKRPAGLIPERSAT